MQLNLIIAYLVEHFSQFLITKQLPIINQNKNKMRQFTKLRGLLYGGFLSAFLCFSLTGYTQNIADYVMVASTDVLNPMAGATNIGVAPNDDACYAGTPLGFTFSFAGNTYSHASASPDGFVRLQNDATVASNQFTNTPNSTINVPKLYPWWDDLALGAVGNGGAVRTLLIGTAPNQTRIFEWFVTMPRALGGTANTRYQLWIHENGNFDFVYGTTGGTTTGASVGITGLGGLYKNVTNTTTNATSSTTQQTLLNAYSTLYGKKYSWSPPSCGGMANVVLTNPGPDTLNVTWDAASFGSVLSYNWEINPAATAQGVGVLFSGNTAGLSMSQGGLNPATTYQFWIQAVCGSPGTWEGPYAFTTPCVAVSTPWTDSFEAATVNNAPPLTCFASQIITGSPTSTWRTQITPIRNGIGPRTGTDYMVHTWSANSWLYSPPVAMLTGETYEFRFWYVHTDAVNGFTLNVGAGTAQNSASMTNLGSIVNVINTTYQEGVYTYTALEDGIHYFGLQCQDSSGAPWYLCTDDWSIIQLVDCAGTPDPGTVPSSLASCFDSGVTIEAVGATVASGITYQWEEFDGVDWIPAVGGSGANTVSFTTPIVAIPTDYRLSITCTFSAETVESAVTTVTPGACYCIPAMSFGCTDGDVIAQVVLNTLDNNSGTGCPSGILGYSDYTNEVAPNFTTELQAGSNYSCTVWAGQYAGNYAAWIDYNDDGIFDISERIGFTTTPVPGSGIVGQLGSSASFPILIDCSPPIGVHRLRIREQFATDGSAITPCADGSFGEIEDYLVTITAADPCPVPGVVTFSNYSGATVDADWDQGCEELQWDIHVTTVGGGEPVGAPTDPNAIQGAPVSLPAPDTNYDFWIRSVCEDGVLFSDWAGPYTFFAPPANNECAFATPLTVHADGDCPANSETFNTTEATFSGIQPACLVTGLVDVFFSFNSGDNSSINWEVTLGSMTVMGMQITDACGGNVVFCQGDVFSGLVFVTPQTEYIIQIMTFPTTWGDFDICLSEGPPSPMDACEAGLSASPGTGISATNPTTVSTITVAPQPGGTFISDLDVALNITHTFVADLDITLTSPCGTTINLQLDQCGAEDNMQAYYDDSATDDFAAWCANGRFGPVIPQEALSAFIDEPIEGTWILAVTDDAGGDDGTLIQWCLVPTLSTCVDPILATSDVTNTSITVDVAASSGCIPPGVYSTFDIAWEDTPGCGAPCGSATGVTFPYTITGLDPSTFYDITVVASCTAGGTSNLVGTGVSTTACAPEDICAYTLTLNRTSGTGFGGALVEVNNGWSVTSYTLGGSETNNTFNIQACPGVQLSVSLNNGGQGGLNSTYEIQLTNSGNVDVLDVSGPSEGQLVVLPDPCPECAAPLNVTLGQFAADYVEVSWTNGGDPADDYFVELNDVTFGFPIPVDFAIVAGTSHAFNFFSSPFTSFDVCVTANCTNGGASLPSCVSFLAPACNAADQCEYVINAFDAGANGWGDYSVDVIIDGGVQTIPYTLESGSSGDMSFFTCGGSTIEVVFNTSGGSGGSGPFTGCNINTSVWPTTTIPINPTGTVTSISTCNFNTEYANISISQGGLYEFTSSVTSDFITVTSGDNTIIADGSVTPLVVNIATPGAYRVYFNDNAACGQAASGCRATTGRRLITCSEPSFDLVLNPSTDNVTLYSAAAGSFCTLADEEVLFSGVTCPTCFDMSAEAVFNVTGTSADFSWESSNGPGAEAVIYIGAPGFDYTVPGEVLFTETVTITVTGQNFGSVSGLSTLTDYEAVIVEECNAPSGDFSLPSSTLAFTTLDACPDAANLTADVGAGSTTICFDVLYPDADYTVTVGQPSSPTWSVRVFSASWGDGTTWTLQNSSNVTVLSGGTYGNGYDDNDNTYVPLPGDEPFTFNITTAGVSDNSPNYSVSCSGTVISGNIPFGGSGTFPGLVCSTPAPPVEYTGTAGVGQECIELTDLDLDTTYEYCVSYDCGVDGSNTVVCDQFTTPALANGICADAIEVSCGSIVAGTTVGAPAYNEYVNCGAFGASPQTGVWYYYQGDNSDVTANTCNNTAPFDTRLTVYRGSCGDFDCVAGNDDGCGLQSSVTFTALTGYDYYIFVHGFSGTGAFELNVSCTPLACTPTAANPYCDLAQTVVPEPFGDCTPILGDNSCSAIATFPTPGCAPAGARIVWYSVTATAVAHNVTINWDGIVSPGLALQASCGVAGGCVAAVADGGFVQLTGLTIGTTYYVGIFSTDANAGAFELCVTDPPPPAPNDLCAGALPLTPGNGVCGPTQPFNSLDFTTTNSPTAIPACGAYNGLDQWFSVVIPASGEVTIRTTAGTITNSAIAAYIGTCAGTLTNIGCSATGAAGDMAQLTVNLGAGTTVFIRAWAEGGGILGTFDVCAIGQPTNDQCATPSNVNTVAETCFNQIGNVNFATAANSPTIPFSSCATNGSGRDVWYQFTAETSTMFITAQGLNGNFDMVVEAWDGCAGTLLGCANDTQGGGAPAPTCWEATGTPGFPANLACQTAVCAQDNFCCTTSWDGICAGIAQGEAACASCEFETPGSAPGTEELTLTGLTPGNTYLLRFYHNSPSAPTGNGLFTFCVRHTWNAFLTPAQCGITTYTSNDALTAVYPGSPLVATGSSRHPLIHVPSSFEWKFVNTSTLNEYYFLYAIPNYNCELQYPVDGLGNQLEYDTEYEVSVRILVDGVWGDFSTTCTIGLQPLPATTQVRPNYTPTNPFGQSYTFCNSVSAENVNFATQYEFEFDNGVDPVSTKISPNYNVQLSSVPGLQMNTIYQVRVRAMVDGVWAPYGIALPIQIGLPANTQLIASNCNSTRQLNQGIAAINVCGASEYVFRFQHATEAERIVVRPSYTCPLWQVQPPLTPGETYNVTVKATQGGIAGDYSTVCPVTIAGPQAEGMADVMISRIATDEITATIFPNPNNGSEVSINLSNIADEHQTVSVEVFDIYGKRVHIEQFANTGSNLNAVISFTQKLASGMYLVNISLNDTQVVAERLVVQ